MADWGFPNPATPPGSERYYLVRFAEPARRDRLAALFALRHKWQARSRSLGDPGVARLQLGWWREELARLAERQAGHPALRLMMPEAARPAFADLLTQLLETVDEELRGLRFEDQPALENFCERSGGTMARLLQQLEGVTPDVDWSNRLGRALSLVELLQRLVEERHQGRLPLPRDWLEQAGGGVDRFVHEPDAATLAVVSRALQLAQEWLEQARPAGGWPSRTLQRWWRMQRAWVDAVSDQPAELLTHQVKLTPLRMLWHGFTARG